MKSIWPMDDYGRWMIMQMRIYLIKCDTRCKFIYDPHARFHARFNGGVDVNVGSSGRPRNRNRNNHRPTAGYVGKPPFVILFQLREIFRRNVMFAWSISKGNVLVACLPRSIYPNDRLGIIIWRSTRLGIFHINIEFHVGHITAVSKHRRKHMLVTI